MEQRQNKHTYRLAKSKHAKQICSHYVKQWQTSWEAYKATKLNPNASLAASLNKKRLQIHEGLAKAQSSLATPIRTEKTVLADFLHRQRVPHCHLAGLPRRVA